VRRGRLPEPGEILFCAATTTAEDVELLLRRFLLARAYGRADAFFVLANAHALSYAIQVGCQSLFPPWPLNVTMECFRDTQMLLRLSRMSSSSQNCV
jgi:hypothetical protein